ncbi:hypothetical protein C7974DRAFT_423746 [Boeremia exigua]|uniref:uncharacterized protein n=1 Tax=Boeremia exigua TaxID=749465 RepID=UPI001E8CE5BA|nr:uncharacterized protein C7974DRAFT_423746 [Boeremia exigua]KAH6633397.1 hypothetical protein C7974DRAFT_423746 [Boeremia exigua]
MGPSAESMGILAEIQKTATSSLYPAEQLQLKRQRHASLEKRIEELRAEDRERARCIESLDRTSDIFRLVRRLLDSNEDLAKQLDEQRTSQERIAELEQRPTIQSHQALQHRINELEGRPTSQSYDALKDRLTELQFDLNDMQRRLSTLEPELEAKSKSLQKLQDELAGLKDSSLSHENQLHEASTKVAGLEQDKDGLMR